MGRTMPTRIAKKLLHTSIRFGISELSTSAPLLTKLREILAHKEIEQWLDAREQCLD